MTAGIESASEVRGDPSVPQKRQALERVLRSETFARSEQLRRFLRYICDQEIAGRHQEITEYSIAVEALGRSPDYNPYEDSSVRNRAHALRRKLEEYYQSEGRSDQVRIRIPRGSYVPRFVHSGSTPEPPHGGANPVSQAADLTHNRPPVQRTSLAFRLATLSAIGFAVCITYLLASIPHRVHPVFREAWGPTLGREANTILLIATPAHMFLRPYPEGQQPTRLRLLEAPPQAYAVYPDTLESNHKLYMLLTRNSPLWGDSVGMATATRLLGAAGTTFHIVPERLLASISAFRDRNLIVFGAPEYSPTVKHMLRDTPLTIAFDPNLQEHIILDRRPSKPDSRLTPVRDRKHLMVHTWGLITVLPSEGAVEGSKRTIIFSGISSAGTQAAVEYFTNRYCLNELKAKFAERQQPAFPPAYQVVVEADITSTMPLRVRYKDHVVLPVTRRYHASKTLRP